MNLPYLQRIFSRGGIVRIPEFITEDLATSLASRALLLAETHGIRRDGSPKRGGRSLHDILDGFVVQEHFPEIAPVYMRAREVAEGIVRKAVILSPYVRSGVNIRVYRQTESEDGWHYDTNPLSALLYLTSGGQPTQFKMHDESLFDIYPEPGLLLLFNGRNLLHHVPRGNHLRITCPLNLYYEDDKDRPADVDKVLFENSDSVRAEVHESRLGEPK